MITISDDGDFTYTIFDVILQLNELDKFVLKIWTNNSELAFTYDESYDFHFLQESIRVSKDNRVIYITLDTIVSIILFKNANIEDMIL